MSNQPTLNALKQWSLNLSNELEDFAERVDELHQQVVRLIPVDDGEEMADGKKDKTPAYLLGERLWFAITDFLEPAAVLLRAEAATEERRKDTSLVEVERVIDQLTERLNPENEKQQIKALQGLRILAADMEEVNELGREFESRSNKSRLRFARLALELSPEASRFVQALGLRPAKKVSHD